MVDIGTCHKVQCSLLLFSDAFYVFAEPKESAGKRKRRQQSGLCLKYGRVISSLVAVEAPKNPNSRALDLVFQNPADNLSIHLRTSREWVRPVNALLPRPIPPSFPSTRSSLPLVFGCSNAAC